MTRQELAQKIWNEWEQGLSYQKKLRLKEICEQCVDFFEGRQWPQATEKTKNLPRPVINIVKFIINNKKANILSSKISTVYKPLIHSQEEAQLATEGASAFTSFANHIKKEIKQEDLDSQAILDGLKKRNIYLSLFLGQRKQKWFSKI